MYARVLKRFSRQFLQLSLVSLKIWRLLGFYYINKFSKSLLSFHLYFLTAKYKFCCHGVHCPNCSLKIDLEVLGKSVPVSSSVQITCTEQLFNTTVNVVYQPGIYDVKVKATRVLVLEVVAVNHRT